MNIVNAAPFEILKILKLLKLVKLETKVAKKVTKGCKKRCDKVVELSKVGC